MEKAELLFLHFSAYMAVSTQLEHLSHPIGVVERETGLGKDTLRVWERRYQFPQPQRDANGERVYPLEQVTKLRLMKNLMDRGHRPGKIVHLAVPELQHLYDAGAKDGLQRDGAAKTDLPHLAVYLDLCKTHQPTELRRTLSQALHRLGIQAFMLEVLAPLNEAVGDLWASGGYAVHEEHMYTEVVQNILRNATWMLEHAHETAPAAPRILMSTFAREPHGLGLLMAEAMFALEGARCISLGLQTPIADIASAAQAHQADIVALSFSVMMNAQHALEGLRDLRAALPPEIGIWIGGSCRGLTRVSPEVAQVLALSDVPQAIRDWRQHKQE